MTFFNSVGFECPPRKGVADFLQEVTSPKDQAVRSVLCYDTAMDAWACVACGYVHPPTDMRTT